MTYSSYPPYTEDITVAGSLLKDKFSGLYESFIKKERRYAACDFASSSQILTELVLEVLFTLNDHLIHVSPEMITLMTYIPSRLAIALAEITFVRSTEQLHELLFIYQVDNVLLVDRWGVEPDIVGTFHVTTSHIIFRSKIGKELWVANGLIGSVDRGPLSVSGCPLIIRCKHFLIINLIISRDRLCQDLYETLLKCIRTVNVNELAAFDARDVGEDVRGWSRLEWAVEFTRQGVDNHWIESDINKSYNSCDTYPERLWVPTCASKTTLMASCRFRSRGRLPVLTYFHRTSGATICRCAQPLTGFSARCVEDEKLMELIGKANAGCDTLYLVDTRPMVNAMVNRVQGKGYEDERNYSNTRFHTFDIANIHVMRTSQQKLVDACANCRNLASYYRALESSGWLKHLRVIVECSVFLADSVDRGISCVVHCSDGWDRTAQTVALAQMLLDPFYRTIHGFQVLIEKDWIGFGYKFDDRCAHIGALNDEAAKEISPIFTQFLDCVHQVMLQRPQAFQFNDRYLIDIHEHAYSCQYGTFVGNCEKDRKDLKLNKRTKSLWTHMDSCLDAYFNPCYEPRKYGAMCDLDTSSAAFKVWHNLYNRFDENFNPPEDIPTNATASTEPVGMVEGHIAALRTRFSELKSQLGKGNAFGANSTSISDSGHSGSSTGLSQSEERLASDLRLPSPESGISGESSLQMDEPLLRHQVRFQSLRDGTHCSAIGCQTEFASPGERRLQCYRCGKTFCRQCVRVTADEGERVCVGCQGHIPDR